MTKETYLGDGLYASFDGDQIRLRAPRDGGDHLVFLEMSVLDAFERYVERLKGGAETRDDKAASCGRRGGSCQCVLASECIYEGTGP